MKFKVCLSLLIVILIFLVSSPNDVNALSCGKVDDDPKERLLTFGGAVYGEVIQIKGEIKQKGFIGPKEYVTNILVDVDRSWNMEVPSQIIVAVDYTWGFPFEKGKSYFLYIQNLDGELVSSPCAPVKEVQLLNQIDKQLGEGNTPTKQVNVAYKMWFMTDKDYDVWILGAMLIVCILVTVFYFK
ncbi:hypothetical protein [Paenibacillus qinlingensis]|uniref:Uncharacterized protein n=1 Tax=Paenibacillus qinlingensis TaxID=1837343 RepID=A0ABU1NZ95_9BACL|nr:hypothetical protein [Paenibacillus qinlingensis]MDR6552629.1 hypothetical protein [Paenibacillus qinlingensis]